MDPTWGLLLLGTFVALAALLNKQRVKKIPYHYSSIPKDTHHIRLLRLMPNKDRSAAIRCKLFNYSLGSDQRTHLYEALSYVWGNPDRTIPIFIDGHCYHVTENLYTALWHLRDRFLERIIWVDAICINQADDKEKEHQIQSIAKIYSQARRVIVWLGEAADDSDQALGLIRVAARDKSTDSSNVKGNQKATLKLLERPWFQRIWVLQEVAAARHVLITCGSLSVDGHAFCLGLDSLMDWYKSRPDLQGLVSSVTYLIRGAIFRPIDQIYMDSGHCLDICPLGELIDMYHTHKATQRHDKVYALLGMSSDDVGKAGLLPDYGLPWDKLLRKLTKFLLHKDIWVHSSSNKEIAVIKSKGRVLGKVSTTCYPALGNKQAVDINFIKVPNRLENAGDLRARWTLQNSAKPVQNGDLICLLHGTSKPTIIRSYKEYFAIIMIAVSPARIQTGTREIEWLELLRLTKHFNRDFLLVWNWENSTGELDYEGLCKSTTETDDIALGYPGEKFEKSEAERRIEKSTRTWDVGLILGDVGEYAEAEERLREAIRGFELTFGEEHSHALSCCWGLTPLSWAAGNGCVAMVDFLLTKGGIDPDLEDSQFGRTPLSWAAENNHEVIVKQLLETGKVNVDAKDTKFGRTPLIWAAANGHEAIVRLLLESCKVDIDVKDRQLGRTPLSWAAGGGHETIVKLLLKSRKVNVDAKDSEHERTPLSWAAGSGHEAIVRLLLETRKVDVNTKANESILSLTPLQFAKGNRHDGVVQLLQPFVTQS